MKHLFTLLIFLTGLSATAQTIAVQGVLRDPKGRTVDDGFYEVVFSIYDQQADGSALWSETHPSLETNNGLFVAKLGTYETLDIAFDTTYYLGIAIEGRAEISPRMELSLAPYALGVFGAENYFPGVGDVRIKDSLSIAEGSLTLGEGNMKLGLGSLQLDSGNLTMQGGDIILNKEGAGIEFADGTKLTTAFGGTAANLSNPNSVIIAADTDEDGVGSIDLNIGDSTHLRIDNAGRVNVRKDVLLDSGQLMAKTGKDLGIGHWNPEDSTYSEVMNMNADGTVVFSGNVKATGQAIADEDLVNLSTLNSYLAPNIPDTAYYDDPIAIGTEIEGGTVFANEGGYTYIAYFWNNYLEVTFSDTWSPWSSSNEFGSGYQNTQNLYSQSGESFSSTFEYQVKGKTINGFNDWFLPSTGEVLRLLTELPGFDQGYHVPSSSRSDCSSTNGYIEYWYDSGNDYYSSCVQGDETDNSSYRIILVRRIPTPQKSELQFEEDSPLTVGALQDYLPEEVYVNDPAIGDWFEEGYVFAIEGEYIYVGRRFNTSSYRLSYYSGAFESSTEFGAGYQNTQNLFEAFSNENQSSTMEYYLNNAPHGYDDWFIPSEQELIRAFQEVSSLQTSDWYGSSSQATCGSSSIRDIYGTSQGKSCTSMTGYPDWLLVRRIPRQIGYNPDDNDFVPVGLLLDRIGQLEAKLDKILNGPEIGTELGGGTVFKVAGGVTFIAAIEDTSDGHPTYDNSGASTELTFGDYSDWYVPSHSELNEVFDNINITNSSSYYWTNQSCGSNQWTLISESNGSTCEWDSSNNGVLYIRKVANSELDY